MRKLLLLISLSYAIAVQGQIALPDSIYLHMKRVADWQWKTLGTEGWKNPKKDWTSGAMYTGMMAFSGLAATDAYYQKLIQVGEDNQWKIGHYRHFADDYCVGQLYSQLYTIYQNPKYIADFKSMADSLVVLPHTESLEWKKSIHMREWAWCDALFMGPPALAYLSQATGDAKYLDKASALWWKSTAYLYDQDEQLFYRDSRYFKKQKKNGAKVFWGRGNGWVIAGLVRVLSTMSTAHPDYKRFIKLYKEMSGRLAALQQPDGTWHASLLDPDSYPSKETSGTGFIAYAMAWGVNNNLLPYKKYKTVLNKAWAALSSSVHADGKLVYVQAQGAAPDVVGYDDTDVYGVGAFLLAGTELFKLKLQQENNGWISTVVNTNATSKKQKVEIPWRSIAKKVADQDPQKVQVKDAATGEIIPLNVDYDGTKPKAINFEVQLSAGATRFFNIQ
ncbi:glycoside hydrolase family 88/105 protein [Pedobacter rhizosphaerae]|uniref:Rhamnogalacturonyl hydrolase YesR n=1 Tax=Pedobacter rhizosphaerae TaxID=390241 RepID=A0A1H9UC13_9SPHI|nr:glycoside hydrolase family 88 protein [Pedobacter rhizosphaerae]SES06694.1 Rhamnogalacturonyl hydrolase YesR [Pedobacter rhizosphaerae]